MVHQGAGQHHSGVEIGESTEQKAERLIAAELKRRNWKEYDLPKLANGDAGKIKLALLLRKQTTMTLQWIAKRLHIGAPVHLANGLHVYKQNNQ